MNRYRAYYPRDDAPLHDGDAQFLGVEERLDPAIVPAGRVSSATNCRFRKGNVEPRKGIGILRCMKADGTTPFTTTRKANIFKIAPPNAYQDWVGTVNFAANGVSDFVMGLYLSEVQTLKRVQVGIPQAFWDTESTGNLPLAVIKNGALVATAFTANLAVTGQDFQIAGDLSSVGGNVLGGNGYGYTLTVTVTLADNSTITAYVVYGP